MPCPVCGISTSTYTGVRFPVSIRRANKFHEALSIPTWMDIGQCYICFDHFNEEDLIVNEEGVILGVRKEAVPNPQKNDPNWAWQRLLQQEARIRQFIDCPFCGLQMNGAERIWLLQTHIEAEHGLRADTRNLKRLVLERRRRIERIQYYTSIQDQQNKEIVENDDSGPGTSCASATVDVVAKSTENGSIANLPSIPGMEGTNLDKIEWVTCTICEEIVSRQKLAIHMYGVHNMFVTNLKMCLASQRPAAQNKKDGKRKGEEKGGKFDQIGYFASQMLPCSSSSIKEAENVNVKTEIIEEIPDGNEEEGPNQKRMDSSKSNKTPPNPPLNMFFRTLLKDNSTSIERQISHEEQMDWALAMTVAVAQEKNAERKVEPRQNGEKMMEAGELAKRNIPQNGHLRPSTVQFRPAKNGELSANSGAMNGRRPMPMNQHFQSSSNIRLSPCSIQSAKDAIGKSKALGGVLSSEYIPSEQWNEEITFSNIEGNCAKSAAQIVRPTIIQPANPHKFDCPLCHKKFILQREMRYHLIFQHNIPPNSRNLVEIERKSVIPHGQPIQPFPLDSSVNLDEKQILKCSEKATNLDQLPAPCRLPSSSQPKIDGPKPWSVNRLLCTLCEQYVLYSNFLTHLAHWHDIHLESEEHIGLYAISGYEEQLQQNDNTHKAFSEEEKARIRKYKVEGHSVYWIAKQLGRPHSLVTYILGKMGIPIHRANIFDKNEMPKENGAKEKKKDEKEAEVVEIDDEDEEEEEGDEEPPQIQYLPVRLQLRTTEEEKQKVREYKAEGYSNNWIARKLGRSHTLINNIVRRLNIKTVKIGRKKRGRSKTESEEKEEEEMEGEDGEEMGDEQPATKGMEERRKCKRRKMPEANDEIEEHSIEGELELKRDRFGRNFCVYCERPIHRRHFLQHLKKAHDMEDVKNSEESIQKYCIKENVQKFNSSNDEIDVKDEPEEEENAAYNAKMRRSLVNKSPKKLKNDKIVPKMEPMEEENRKELNGIECGNKNKNIVDHDYGCAT